MNNKKLTQNIAGTFIIMLMLISLTQAFAISSPYMENKQLQVYPGEIKELQFVLQNGGTTDEITAKAEVLEGDSIVQITDSNNVYSIQGGQKADVNMRVTIPQDAKIGDSYQIRLGFSTVTDSSSGQFNFGSRIEQTFTIVVGAKPLPPPQTSPPSDLIASKGYLIIIGIIVLAAIVFIIIKRKRK